MEPLVINVETAARILGIGRSLAYRLCRENSLHGTAIKFGDRWVVSRSKLIKLINGDEKDNLDAKPS